MTELWMTLNVDKVFSNINSLTILIKKPIADLKVIYFSFLNFLFISFYVDVNIIVLRYAVCNLTE